MKKRFSNSRLSQKTLIIAVVALIVVFGFFFTYDKLVSPTRIALVNFQPYMATSIQLANTDKFIKYENMSLDELRKLNSADFVLAFGMGLKMSAEQRVYRGEREACIFEKAQQPQVEANRQHQQRFFSLLRAGNGQRKQPVGRDGKEHQQDVVRLPPGIEK